jgi:hypothetical protein
MMKTETKIKNDITKFTGQAIISFQYERGKINIIFFFLVKKNNKKKKEKTLVLENN